MADPIPVYVLTGFLGAGKTTLLNHLLSLPRFHDADLALVVNDFGPVNIDGRLVRPGDYERFDLSRGSLFCACIQGDVIAALRDIADRVRPDAVIVEATGVADPCDLTALFEQGGLAGRFEIRAGLCVIDSARFTRVAAFAEAAQRQVAWADGIVVNKTDAAAADELDRLDEVLERLHPDAPRVRVEYGAIPPGFVDGLRHPPRDAEPRLAPPALVSAVAVRTESINSRKRLESIVRDLGERLLRLKGFVDFGDGFRLVESVFDDLTERDVPDGADPEPVLTVIVQGLDPGAVRLRFAPATD